LIGKEFPLEKGCSERVVFGILPDLGYSILDAIEVESSLDILLGIGIDGHFLPEVFYLSDSFSEVLHIFNWSVHDSNAGVRS